jgi:hypothetical protein
VTGFHRQCIDSDHNPITYPVQAVLLSWLDANDASYCMLVYAYLVRAFRGRRPKKIRKSPYWSTNSERISLAPSPKPQV